MTVKEAFAQREAKWDQEIGMTGSTYWKFERNVLPLRDFFRHLPKIFPPGGTIMFEGLEIGLSAKALYEEHPANYLANVSCDTIHPVPVSYHVAYTDELIRKLCLLVESQGMEAVFYHFKGYTKTEVIFSFHSWRNNLEGSLSLAGNLEESRVTSFANALNCATELVPFPHDMHQKLRRINQALSPPWWKRLARLVSSKK